MIVRDYNEEIKTERRVNSDGWHSVRLLLADDKMGFSFHITTIHADTELHFHYKNHLESVYCVAGEGSIEDVATGEVHEIRPGVMYALDKNDKHILRGKTEMTMACVFNPPVTGKEVHREDGSYATAEEELASASARA
jgi:L-ectoine synthase